VLSKSEVRHLLEEVDFVPEFAGKLMKPFRIVRKLSEHEVKRCGRWVGEDAQSGPIYCGRIAEYKCIDVNGLMLFLCREHGEH